MHIWNQNLTLTYTNTNPTNLITFSVSFTYVANYDLSRCDHDLTWPNMATTVQNALRKLGRNMCINLDPYKFTIWTFTNIILVKDEKEFRNICERRKVHI
jgi:hypothetical protein